ncbi:hypothetical protein Cgig2_017297 [Carnegiea gigantea]|uniref:Uncharacterized protein n=1 Tax=Carnegiea gigantea TaxID=171969 RepID=A0A9Q1KGF4_9CARY|nr:hypothetical protein Cgig2_017297 [Carnegiea gigantea]
MDHVLQIAATVPVVMVLQVVELVRYIWDMSADTAKENASFVDSSATQKQDAVNLEDPDPTVLIENTGNNGLGSPPRGDNLTVGLAEVTPRSSLGSGLGRVPPQQKMGWRITLIMGLAQLTLRITPAGALGWVPQQEQTDPATQMGRQKLGQ